MTDARTTPRALQVPALLLLFAVTAYFLVCFQHALAQGIPAWAILGNWQMFTVIDRSHHAVEAEAYVDGAWAPLDLEVLFPAMWDGGPRYANAFRKSPHRLRVLADSACDRDPRKPERVRLFDLRWRAVPGKPAFPAKNVDRKEMLDWACAKTAPRPQGIRW